MVERRFNLDLARMILEGKVKANIYSIDGHLMKLKEVHLTSAKLTYIDEVNACGDGPIVDKSFDVEVDYRGYFCGDQYRAVSVRKILVFDEEPESRINLDNELELVSRRVHNKWEPEVYKNLMLYKGKPTFYSRLCNLVAQMAYDRRHGKGAFSKLSREDKYQLYQEASFHVDAVRDLGHLLN